MAPPPPQPQVFAILHEGQIWHGDCALVGGRMICVRSAYGGKTVSIGRRRPEQVAAELLEQLVRDWLQEREARQIERETLRVARTGRVRNPKAR